MKVSCEIIKDLLPLYKDEVCSEDSQRLIQEHLQTCDECKKLFEQMNIDINIEQKELNIKEADAIERLSKKWNKHLILSMVKGAVLTLVIVILVLLFISIFIGIKIG